MRGVRRAALLVAFWLLAWGELSVANTLSGLVVAVGLLLAFPPYRQLGARPHVSLIGAVRLVIYVFVQLVPSTVLVAREVLSRRSRIRTGVLAYPLDHPSDEVLSLMSHVIALVPGTMTVEATRDPWVLYVHFLLLDDVEHARRTVARLEGLAVAVLGGPERLRAGSAPATAEGAA